MLGPVECSSYLRKRELTPTSQTDTLDHTHTSQRESQTLCAQDYYICRVRSRGMRSPLAPSSLSISPRSPLSGVGPHPSPVSSSLLLLLLHLCLFLCSSLSPIPLPFPSSLHIVPSSLLWFLPPSCAQILESLPPYDQPHLPPSLPMPWSLMLLLIFSLSFPPPPLSISFPDSSLHHPHPTSSIPLPPRSCCP
jgi:hypothetical protein